MRGLLPARFALLAALVLGASQACAATGDWPQFGFTRRWTPEQYAGDDPGQEDRRAVDPEMDRKHPGRHVLGCGGKRYRLRRFDRQPSLRIRRKNRCAGVAGGDRRSHHVVTSGSRRRCLCWIERRTRLRVRCRDRCSSLVNANQRLQQLEPRRFPVAVAGGLVYAGTTDGNMFALSAGTGAVKWTKTFVFGGVASARRRTRHRLFRERLWG